MFPTTYGSKYRISSAQVMSPLTLGWLTVAVCDSQNQLKGTSVRWVLHGSWLNIYESWHECIISEIEIDAVLMLSTAMTLSLLNWFLSLFSVGSRGLCWFSSLSPTPPSSHGPRQNCNYTVLPYAFTLIQTYLWQYTQFKLRTTKFVRGLMSFYREWLAIYRRDGRPNPGNVAGVT